jgi:dipeptidyl aminopeptidase/acylaminoacyl peptidase
MPRRLLFLAFAVIVAVSTAAMPTDALAEPPTVSVDQVLRLGPLPLPLPAFHDADRHGLTLEDLAGTPTLDVAILRPQEGDEIAAPGGLRWHTESLPATIETGDDPAEIWLAFYLRSDRWQEATLTVSGPDDAHLQAWLNGGELSLETDDDQNRTVDLDLPMGTHLVLLRSVVPAELDESWHHGLALTQAEDDDARGTLVPTTETRRPADIDLVLDTPRLQQVAISPDGSLVALRLQERPAGGEPRDWLEIRERQSGDLVATWQGLAASRLTWAPDGRRLGYVLSEDGASDLWLADLETGATNRLLRGIEHLSGYQWAPSGEFVVYSVRVEAEKDDRKVKRVTEPADRQPWHRDRSYLMMAWVPEGVTRRLTTGPLSPGSWSISPDSERLLFFLGEQDLAGGRPYFSSELWELDLTTLAAEKLLADRWISGADYGPDDDTLLLRGSPSAFSGLGRNLPEDVQANDYGGQLFLYDRDSGQARWITRELRPDVAEVWWSRADGHIYALCTDTQFRRVYRHDPGAEAWERVETGVEYVDQFDLARNESAAVVRGTSVTTPNRAYGLDLRRNRARLLLDPGIDHWHDVAFGEVTYWKAPLPDGEELDGRIYWPVDHDPDRTYPVIVYYYGGTSPVTVDFGGRYPKNVWSGQGYIVYVPQPSGATGYGQEFAARHVNDWGERTAWEVIESTKAFLAAHPSADPERVGCIGASYGGFLTMNVITKTDLFAAAVSHAGISSISSYWGEGLWGYAYGARALADAFPWDRRDVYVEQSALFHADKITTPLLLVHGDSDTNVPVGESDQLFTALKLLGREVEYVQIQGQDHWILDHDQRIVWNDTILAFFARYLKDRDAWWQALYPED